MEQWTVVQNGTDLIQLIYVIISFLYERYFQFRRINDSVSEVQLVSVDVPQGSVLPPRLFIICSADYKISQNAFLAQFARTVSNLSRLLSRMSKMIWNLLNWKWRQCR